MRRLPSLLFTCGLLTLTAFALHAAADDAPPPNPSKPPTTRPDGPPPAGFHLLPRFVTEKLNLTPDQAKQVADLEKETKAKLDQILTADQKKILDNARPPRRDGPPPAGPDNTGGGPHGGPGGQTSSTQSRPAHR